MEENKYKFCDSEALQNFHVQNHFHVYTKMSACNDKIVFVVHNL